MNKKEREIIRDIKYIVKSAIKDIELDIKKDINKIIANNERLSNVL